MIEAKNLIKKYGDFLAVDDISFQVNRGDILGFLGPNGAGKSTTMKMLTGFLPITSGEASIGGHSIAENPVRAKELIGYLPESGPLYPEMSVLEFIQFMADLRLLEGQSRKDAINRVVNACNLQNVLHQTIDTLSKGYRQRVGLAQAILDDPDYLVLDEPTDGLDPNQKQEVRKLIASMSEDKAVILSTHILEEVEAMCNRVIIITNGHIVADESPEALQQRHRCYNAVEIVTSPEFLNQLKRDLGELDVTKQVEAANENKLIVFPKEKEKPLESLLLEAAKNRNWQLEAVRPVDTPLREVFQELTQQRAS